MLSLSRAQKRSAALEGRGGGRLTRRLLLQLLHIYQNQISERCLAQFRDAVESGRSIVLGHGAVRRQIPSKWNHAAKAAQQCEVRLYVRLGQPLRDMRAALERSPSDSPARNSAEVALFCIAINYALVFHTAYPSPTFSQALHAALIRSSGALEACIVLSHYSNQCHRRNIRVTLQSWHGSVSTEQ